MIFTLERVTNPEIEPVTLDEMKRHLRTFAEATVDDDDISGLIMGAREWVEDYTGRALIDQTWRLTVTRMGFGRDDILSGFTRFGNYYRGFIWNNTGLQLRRAPVLSIESFVTVDVDGAETAVDPATYELLEAASKWPSLVQRGAASWAAPTLRIVFRAGFADRASSPQQDAEAVPVRFKQAIKLWVEANYDRDEKMMPILMRFAQDMLRAERSDLQLG